MSIPHADIESATSVDAIGVPADRAPPRSLWRDWRTLRYLIGPLVLGVLASVVILEIVFVVGLGIVIVQLFQGPRLWRRFGPQAVPLTLLRLGIFVLVVTLASAAPLKRLDRPWTPYVNTDAEVSDKEIFELGARLGGGGVTFQFPESTPYAAVVLPVKGLSVREAVAVLERQTGLVARVGFHCGNGQTLLWGHSSGCTITFKEPPPEREDMATHTGH